MTEYVLAAEQPEVVDMKLTDDLFIKVVIVKHAGTVIPQHSHHYEHISLLSVGEMRVWADDVLLGDYVAPVGILIRAGVKHRMQTLTDGVQFSCIHALHGTDDVEVLEEHHLTLVDEL